MNQNIEIVIPEKYTTRMVGDWAGNIHVYAEAEHRIYLGRVGEVSEALQLLDSYDGMLRRRDTIAKKVDEDSFKLGGESDHRTV